MKAFGILFLIFAYSVSIYSQTDRRLVKLSGTVFDTGGAVIPQTEVSATGKSGEKYVTKTDSVGRYEIDLPLGEFDIEFKRDGFKILIIQKFRLENEVAKTQDMVLEGYVVCELAPVVDDRRPVEASSGEISRAISIKPLERLPKQQNKSKRKKINNKQ